MLCRSAMITGVISVSEDMKISEALSILRKHNIRSVPVINAVAHPVGMFGLRQLLKSLLPNVATIEGGVSNLDFVKAADTEVIGRLRVLNAQPVKTVMDTNIATVEPDTVFWEGMRLLFQHNTPLPVVDPKTGAMVGLISGQAAIGHLLDRDSDG